MSILKEFADEVRAIARKEARRAAPRPSKWLVIKVKPFTVEAFDSDRRLVDGEDDFEVLRNVKANAKRNDVVLVVTDAEGEKVAVGTILRAGKKDPTGKSVGWGPNAGDESGDADEEEDEDEGEEEEAPGIGKTKGCVIHGEDPNAPRPSGYSSVEWIGTVEPVNAIDNDTWVNPGLP